MLLGNKPPMGWLKNGLGAAGFIPALANGLVILTGIMGIIGEGLIAI